MSAGTCRGCGCTDARACPDGCSWISEDEEFCSACQSRMEALAFQFADATARSSIEAAARTVSSGQHEWYDLGSIPARDLRWTEDSLAYMDLRGDRLDFLVIRGKAFPSLIRFEDVA